LILFCLQNNPLESDKEVRCEDARCCKNQSTVPAFLLHLHKLQKKLSPDWSPEVAERQ